MPEVITIETPGLGDRSYLVHDGARAFVVDPQRDIDRILTVAGARNLEITHVLETHIHNDYVTGGYALASQTGATYVVAAAEDVSFERMAVADRDQIRVGSLTVTVLHTRGIRRVTSPTRSAMPHRTRWPFSPADPCCTARWAAPT